MEISHGKYLTKYSENNETWDTYYKNILIASTQKDLWEDNNIEFNSRQAGEVLLYTTIELTAAISESLDNEKFDKPVHDEFPDLKHQEPHMEKTDEGDVKNVENPPDKIQYNSVDPEEKEIIDMITELLEKAFEMQHDNEDTACIDKKIDAMVNKYRTVQSSKLKRKLYSVLNASRHALNDNLDCSAELEEAEKIVEALKRL